MLVFGTFYLFENIYIVYIYWIVLFIWKYIHSIYGILTFTVWKVSKYGVFSGPYFPVYGLNTERYGVSLSVFSPNAGKYGSELAPYLDTFHVDCVKALINFFFFENYLLSFSDVVIGIISWEVSLRGG